MTAAKKSAATSATKKRVTRAKTIASHPGESPAPARKSDRGAAPKDLSATYSMRLYIAGQTNRSTAAIANLKKICETHLAGRYTIEVIDLMKTPQLARDHQILAVPTLIRELPEPLKRVIGDLSDTERALVGLDLRPGA
jgi:circadian clock protein KaiB